MKLFYQRCDPGLCTTNDTEILINRFILLRSSMRYLINGRMKFAIILPTHVKTHYTV